MKPHIALNIHILFIYKNRALSLAILLARLLDNEPFSYSLKSTLFFVFIFEKYTYKCISNHTHCTLHAARTNNVKIWKRKKIKCYNNKFSFSLIDTHKNVHLNTVSYACLHHILRMVFLWRKKISKFISGKSHDLHQYEKPKLRAEWKKKKNN